MKDFDEEIIVINSSDCQLEIANKCNEYIAPFGNSLTVSQIKKIEEEKTKILQNCGRIEFDFHTTERLIYNFCDSPYINNYNLEDTICKLLDVFFDFRNRLSDFISDDEIMLNMKKAFDTIAGGDCDYLCSIDEKKLMEGDFNAEHNT